MNENTTDLEKFKIFVEGKISKGAERMEELSIYSGKLNTKQILNIDDFKQEEREFIEDSKNAFFLLNIKNQTDIDKNLEKLLADYSSEINSFAKDFPL